MLNGVCLMQITVSHCAVDSVCVSENKGIKMEARCSNNVAQDIRRRLCRILRKCETKIIACPVYTPGVITLNSLNADLWGTFDRLTYHFSQKSAMSSRCSRSVWQYCPPVDTEASSAG
jgi:hypothetical protein